VALIVRIYVNDTLIGIESAQRIQGGTHPNSINTYQLQSNGKKIKHRYGAGATVLAEKMVRNLEQQERKHGLHGNRESVQESKNS